MESASSASFSSSKSRLGWFGFGTILASGTSTAGPFPTPPGVPLPSCAPDTSDAVLLISDDSPLPRPPLLATLDHLIG